LFLRQAIPERRDGIGHFDLRAGNTDDLALKKNNQIAEKILLEIKHSTLNFNIGTSKS
jgi:hypothetical protein